METQIEDYIRKTFELASEAAKAGSDPFGAILVFNNEIVAESFDRSVINSDPTYHAELSLISEYCRNNNIIALDGYELYSSTEPCTMCSGAIHWARISKVVFGVSQRSLQSKSGGKMKPSADKMINTGSKKVEVIGPVLEEEGLKVFQEYPLTSKADKHKKLFGQ